MHTYSQQGGGKTLAPTPCTPLPKARLPNIITSASPDARVAKVTSRGESSSDSSPSDGSLSSRHFGSNSQESECASAQSMSAGGGLPALSSPAMSSASTISSASTPVLSPSSSSSHKDCSSAALIASSTSCASAINSTLKWVVGKQFPIVLNEIYFMCVRNEEKVKEIVQWQRDHARNGDRVFFCPDQELQYFPFCADFGPMHYGMTYRFIMMLRSNIAHAQSQGKKVVVYTMADSVSRTNTAMLLVLYLVLERGFKAEDAAAPFTFAGRQPFLPFRDASFQPVTFELHFIDVARGAEKAQKQGFIDLPTFDLELYEYCDHPSMADLHVIVPDKFIAMKGPHTRSHFKDGVQFLAPSRYFDIFTKFGVSAVVRLNNEQYPAKAFRDAGYNHYDIIFDDCTTPDQSVLDAWWDVCRKEKGTIAVHCKAGLGRTGTLICLWLMRKYRWTGREAIGYCRLIRPGSILGPQQEYLVGKEQEMWELGDPDIAPAPQRVLKTNSQKKVLVSGGISRSKSADAVLASKILAQENTEAMNRRAAQMAAMRRQTKL